MDSSERRALRVPPLDHRATVPALLARAVERFGDDDYVVTPHDRLSFRSAEARSADLARRLLAAGCGKGTRIGIILPSGVEFAVAFLAAARIGAVAMLLSTTYRPAELARVLRQSDTHLLLAPRRMLGRDYHAHLEEALPGLAAHRAGPLRLPSAPYLRAVWMVGGADRPWAVPVHLDGSPGAPGSPHSPGEAPDVDAELLAGVEAEVSPADLLLCIFTSGSTADPKGVLHTHGAAVRKVHPSTGMGLAASTPGERVFSAMPFFWVGGPQVLLGALHSGAAVICQERFEPEEALELIERERATSASGWATVLESLRAHPSASRHDLSSMRAAEPPPGFVSSRGDTVNLGMTETLGPHRNRDYFDYLVIDPVTGEVLPDGEVGEFCVRGFGLMAGLLKREREETFDAGGYYHTGDLGYLEEGRIYFTGRRSETIKSGGANVSPLEVESTLTGFPDVAQAFVMGVPHPTRGEEVVALVVPAPGATLDPDELRARVNTRLSAYKVPRRILVLAADQVPQLATGKPDKRAMKAMVLDGETSAPAPGDASRR